ncbi:MAG: hypothetical protein MUO58_18875 [Anaerolineales bacterium]|nr:hypothetical protein [Anaerolineales bacterium]
MPVFVEDVWSSESPEVGKIVTMGMRIKSISDEDNIVFVLDFPDTIAAFDNPSRREFGLKAKEEIEIYTDICVLETGAWIIQVGIASQRENGEFKYGDRRAIGVISYPTQAKVILEKDITYSQAEETQWASIPAKKITYDQCTR